MIKKLKLSNFANKVKALKNFDKKSFQTLSRKLNLSNFDKKVKLSNFDKKVKNFQTKIKSYNLGKYTFYNLKMKTILLSNKDKSFSIKLIVKSSILN